MKISKVEIFLFKCNPKVYNRPVGVRVWTDEGIYGDGEASMHYGNGTEGVYGLLESLVPLVLGMNPLENEVIWNKIHKSTFWGQSPGPAFFSALSAIDIALWDIKGKFLNAPLYEVLGGRIRTDLRCYASQLQMGFRESTEMAFSIDEYVDICKYAVSIGYDAIKLDFNSFSKARGERADPDAVIGPMKPEYVAMVEDRVAAIREAIGPEVDIIIENHSKLDANGSIQVGRALEKYNIMYFEEPNTPSPKTAKYISDNINIPIANGERIFSRWQFIPYFENMSLQIAQPDLTSCGGLTEGKKICDLAHVYDSTVQLHVCGTPISTAVAMHLESVLPNFLIHEEHAICLYPGIRNLCIYDYQAENGMRRAPDLPGIGNEWSEQAIVEAERKMTLEYK